jgi:acyl-CoA dehydrogenase family protein 9
LAERSPGEARAVARVLADLRRLEGDVIDAARFDEEETVPAPVIQALAGIGMLGLTIPEEYGGLGLSATGSARVGEAILDEAAPGRPAPGAP